MSTNVARHAAPGSAAWNTLFIVWLVSLVSMLGSLFFSEVMELTPCVLCWYQRIAMYPLVPILVVGLAAKDVRVTRYAWPLVVAGLAVATYHNLLYYGWIAESIIPCRTGVSCTDRQLEWLGFITIPLLALIAFVVIAIGLWRFDRARKGSVLHDVQ